VVIRTPDQTLRVLVSSTLGEPAEERSAVARAVPALRLTPELFGWGPWPHPPREMYRAYPAQIDAFIGLYRQHYGSPAVKTSGVELARALLIPVGAASVLRRRRYPRACR
jgi:hypothetical protein